MTYESDTNDREFGVTSSDAALIGLTKKYFIIVYITSN